MSALYLELDLYRAFTTTAVFLYLFGDFESEEELLA